MTVLCFICGTMLGFGSRWTMSIDLHPNALYHFDSAYQEIVIHDRMIGSRQVRVFHTNGAFSSGIDMETKTSPFEYVRKTMGIIEDQQPESMLVI